MEQIQTVLSLINAFNEAWNDSNPEHRLSKELLAKVETHLHYAFVAGCDEFSEYMMKEANRNKTKNNSLSISHLKHTIQNFKP